MDMDILALSKLLQDPDLESKNVEEGPQDNNITLTPPASFGNNGGDKIKLENNLVDAENILASNFVSSNDDREEPRYQLYYKQLVGTEDVFLGTEKSPASFDSTHIILKVHFPGRVLNDLKLNVTTNRLTVESPDRKLSICLPRPVDSEIGKAQWDGTKCLLIVSLPIDRSQDMF